MKISKKQALKVAAAVVVSLILLAILAVVIKAFLLPRLPTQWQSNFIWIGGTLLTTVALLAGLAQLTGYSLRDLWPLQIAPVEWHGPPEIALEFIEGNEYVYSLKPPVREDQQSLPAANVEFHLRIRNVTPLEVHIISIEGGFASSAIAHLYAAKATSWHPLISTFVADYTEVVNEHPYPIDLGPHQSMFVNLHSELDFAPHYNCAQFAARLLHIEEKPNPKMTVKVEVQGEDGTIVTSKMEREISLTPLKSLYIEKWQREGQQRLLAMANAA
jgi:hypothetical protein